MRVRVLCALLALVAWVATAPPAPAADPGRWVETGHSPVPARVLPGRHLGPAKQPLLRRPLRRPLPDRPRAQRAGPQRQRDPARRAHARGLQPHRRHHLGPPRGRPRPAAARVLLPVHGNIVPDGLDRRRRPGHAAVALLREARPGLHRQGDVGRGVARRQAAVDLERQRQRPARLRHGRHHGGERRARRAAAQAGARCSTARSRRAASPARPSTRTGCCVAGQRGGPFQVWSIDLADGSRRLEIEKTDRRRVRGARHREGARRRAALADHAAPGRRPPPTYGKTSALVHFERAKGRFKP